MKNTPQKINVLMICLLIVACLTACALFELIPFASMNTGLVYKDF